jgi:hypothetical protein
MSVVISHVLKMLVILVGLLIINRGFKVKDGGLRKILRYLRLELSRDRLLGFLLVISVLVQTVLLTFPLSFGSIEQRLIDLAWQDPFGGYQSSLFHYPGVAYLWSFIQVDLGQDPSILLKSLEDAQKAGEFLFWITAWGNVYLLVIVQKLLFLFIVLGIYKIVLQATNRIYAFAVAILFATNVSIAIWTQTLTSAFLLSGLLTYYTFQLFRDYRNVNWYVFGFLCGLMVLIRPNSLFVVPVALLFMGWKNKIDLKNSGIYLGMALIIYGLFIGLVHEPSTGTFAYSFNGGTNLFMRMNHIGAMPERSFGPYSSEVLEYSSRKPTSKLSLSQFSRNYKPRKVLEPSSFELKDNAIIEPLELLWFLGFERGSKTMLKASLETIVQHPWDYIASFADYFTQSTRDVFRRSMNLLPNVKDLALAEVTTNGVQFGEDITTQQRITNSGSEFVKHWSYYRPVVYLVSSLTGLFALFDPALLLTGVGLSIIFMIYPNRARAAIRRLIVTVGAYLLPTLAFAGVVDGRYIYPILPIMYIVSALILYLIGTLVLSYVRSVVNKCQ